MDFTSFDCIDIGGDSNSIEWAKQYLGATNPIGLNIEKIRLDNMRRDGISCVEMNAFDIPDGVRVDYVFMSHLLEHLETAQQVIDLVEKSVKMAKKGVYIGGPFFEDDNYLRSYGLKFVWGDWIDHISRFGVYNFLPQLRHTMKGQVTTSLGFPIFDSSPDNVVAIDERSNIMSYETQCTTPKDKVSFARPIFQEFLTFIKIDPTVDHAKIHEIRHGKQGLASWLLWENAETEALAAIHRLAY